MEPLENESKSVEKHAQLHGPDSANCAADGRRIDLWEALHGIGLLLVYGFFVIKALLEFNPQWDYLAYHLPDALARFNLTSYTPEPFLQRVNTAWPPLAHLVQGALIFFTGRLSTGNGANAVLFLIVVAALRCVLENFISWRWFLTALLAVPLFLFHFVSGYTDLFASLWILLAWGALLALEQKGGEHYHTGRALLLLIIGVAGAAFSKLQMWPAVAVIVLYCFVRLLQLWRGGRLCGKRATTALLLLVVVSAAWPLRNLCIFHNPTYPVRFPIAPSLFPNYSRLESTERDIPSYLRERSEPAAFLHSVFELNRLETSEPHRWWLDQSAAKGERSPHHRMGGWYFVTVALMLAFWALCLRRKLLPTGPMLLFASLCLVTAFVPQSHELRYWLYLPLVSAIAVGRGVLSEGRLVVLPLKLSLLFAAAFVIGATNLLTLDTRAPESYAPAEAVSFWAAQREAPAEVVTSICGKMPNTIFWAGPTFNEFPVRACVVKP